MRTLFRWLSTWPLWMLHAFGGALGWLSYALSPSYRQRFDANAAQAGVPRSASRAAVAEAGRLILELPYLWMRPADAPIRPPVGWTGAEHIDAAHRAGRGIVFLTPHMGSFEVTAQAYAERCGHEHPMTVLYRPARKPWLRDLVDTSRARPGLAAAPATLAGVRQMIRALRRGEAVGLLPDQVPPEGQGLWVPFFGRPAYTMTLAARLVQQTGAAIILARCERLSWGRGYVLYVEPGPQLAPDMEAALRQINEAMEQLIRACPGQYLWGYGRYKKPRVERMEAAA